MAQDEDLFMQLILGLQSSAWMLLGKVANPMNGQMYKNLEEADRTIKILMMLEQKTKGNLSDAEKETLKSIVQQLQINYVEEIKKEDPKKTDTSTQGEEQKKEENVDQENNNNPA